MAVQKYSLHRFGMPVGEQGLTLIEMLHQGKYHPDEINWEDNATLPELTTRSFSPSNNPPAEMLENPLLYAAKWGGFQDRNDNDLPDMTSEWDADADGSPDTYFCNFSITLGIAQNV